MKLKYLDSPHVSRGEIYDFVATIKLPDGEEIPLTAEQVVEAKIEDHGNFGRSKIIVSLEIVIEAQGTPEAYKIYFEKALLKNIQDLRESHSKLLKINHGIREERDKLASDARAAAVREVSIEVANSSKSKSKSRNGKS